MRPRTKYKMKFFLILIILVGKIAQLQYLRIMDISNKGFKQFIRSIHWVCKGIDIFILRLSMYICEHVSTCSD